MNLWRYCRTFRCLPEPGSLEDQNPALLELITTVDEWHRQLERESGLGLVGALFGGSTRA